MINLATRLKLKLEKLVTDYAREITFSLAITTPVDTGQAISNWYQTVNSPFGTFVSAHVPGRHGSTWNQNVAATVKDADAMPGVFLSNHSIYIANNAPYIEKLNRGFSIQAPPGYIQTAIAKGVYSISSTSHLGF